VKQSKKQKKIGKVMREFKSGTLKSGGSGKKVTNPKQAIAIALSEANAMNQGGMMQNKVMQRPMFQTPMQRESMGIMAGVAPIRGYQDGGEAEEIAVTASSPEELDIKLFGEGGILFDTDSPISSTLMALTIPLGGGAIALTARGLMAARKAAQVAGKIKPRVKVSGAGGKPRVKASDIKPSPPAPTNIGGRMAAAAKRNPGKTALGALTAAGLSTIPFGGEEKKPVDTTVVTEEETGDVETVEEPGFFQRAFEKMTDPRLQYQLAKAGQATEGRVPRNFFSDMAIAGREYDLQQAEIDKASKTAFTTNFEALREIYPDSVSDSEIASMLLTDSDDAQSNFLTLFSAATKGGLTPDLDTIKLLSAITGYELPEGAEEALVEITPESATLE